MSYSKRELLDVFWGGPYPLPLPPYKNFFAIHIVILVVCMSIAIVTALFFKYVFKGMHNSGNLIARLEHHLYHKKICLINIAAGKSIGSFVKYQVRSLLDLTYGELGFMILWFVSICTWFLYYTNYGYFVSKSLLGRGEALARGLGEVNFINFGFVFMPIARNSIWLRIFGISFERAVRFHRWWGRFLFAILTAHAVGMLIVYSKRPEGISFVFRMSSNDQYFNLAGPLTWICVALMFTLSLERVRRTWFEAFYYPHFLFVAAVVFGFLHMGQLVYWAGPGVGLYLVDIALRAAQHYTRSFKVTHINSVPPNFNSVPPEAVTHIIISRKGHQKLNYSAGQFVFVNFPEFSRLAWHPFSISSSPFCPLTTSFTASYGTLHSTSSSSPVLPSNSFSLHVKNMGGNGLTNYLFECGRNQKCPAVRVEGPYGLPSVNIAHYNTVVLVAGGIGITPILPTFEEICNSGRAYKKVLLIWVVRDLSVVAWFASRINSVTGHRDPESSKQSEGNVFDAHIFVTGRVELNQHGPELNIERGRPDFSSILSSLPKSEDVSSKCAVLACGPTLLVDSVQDLCTKLTTSSHYFHFHKEVFAF